MAENLQQTLNVSGDSLMLNCDQRIYKVEIFNSALNKEHIIKAYNTAIPLQNLPLGRYVVLVKLPDKSIAITLLRNGFYKGFEATIVNDVVSAKTNKLSEAKKRSKTVESSSKNNAVRPIAKSQLNKQNTSQFFKAEMTKPETNYAVEGYWVVKTSQGRIGKKIIRHFATADDLYDLLTRIKLEHKTSTGKYNTLQIWEIYNLAQFKIEHAKDRNYINTTDSPYFNATPYCFSSKNVALNLIP